MYCGKIDWILDIRHGYENWLEIERGYDTTYLEEEKNEIEEKKQFKLVTFKYLEFCQGENGIEQQRRRLH